MEMAAKLQLPVHLIGIVPATDNCVDGKAVKPSDVIGSYSGKTIEIIDTDAEGRVDPIRRHCVYASPLQARNINRLGDFNGQCSSNPWIPRWGIVY